MKIGDLAERTGVPPRMLRYYEEQGLLEPTRNPNGYRAYDSTDVDRVTTVRGLIQSGMPTRLVRIVLEMEDPDSSWTQHCTRDFAEVLAAELSALECRIDCLTRSRDTIRHFLERTQNADLCEEAPRPAS